jgi:hypothetical protein
MGSPDSGSHGPRRAKRTTSDFLKLDVRLWAREGVLTPGYSGTRCWQLDGKIIHAVHVRSAFGQMILTYSHNVSSEAWRDEQYIVRIERTSCHLGGSRPWFVCPAVGCQRRVAMLYGGAIFACRHCYRLAYRCTRESDGDRATRRADRLRAQLGWEPGILNGGGPKPKWMRWSTFERLAREHDHVVQRALRLL